MLSHLFFMTIGLSGFFGGTDSSLIVRKDTEIQEGQHFKNLVLLDGQMRFGASAENLVILGGEAILEGSARIENLYLFEGSVEQKEGAEVKNFGGKGENLLFDVWAWAKLFKEKLDDTLENIIGWEKDKLWGFLSSFLLALPILFGVLLFILIPGLGEASSYELRRAPFQSLFLGVVFVVSLIPMSLLLIISLIGILFLPFLFIFYLLILWLGFFVFAIFLGRLILSFFKVQHRIIALFLGLFILFFVLSIPGANFWIYQILSLMGCGGILLSLFSNRIQIYKV